MGRRLAKKTKSAIKKVQTAPYQNARLRAGLYRSAKDRTVELSDSKTKGHDPLEDVKCRAGERWIIAVNADGAYGVLALCYSKERIGHPGYFKVNNVAILLLPSLPLPTV